VTLMLAAGRSEPQPALPDEVLDRFLDRPLYFGRIGRPIFSGHIFSWHIWIPFLVLSLSARLSSGALIQVAEHMSSLA
jgi:hypothetical protein